MSDMLSIGASALQAFQQALNVTSNNISNASTPGYSRETLDLAAQQPQTYGGGYGGAGVVVANVNRNFNGLLASQLWSAQSANSRLDTFTSNAQTVSNMLASTTTGLSATLQQFVNSVQGVSNAPTSAAARQVMLGQATALQTQLQTYDSRLNQLDSQVNTQLTAEASTITGIAQNIATLNGQISLAKSSGQSPNALMDARDQQISDLSKHVNVTTLNQADGTTSVFIGQGQSLVLGSQAGSIVAQQDPYNPARVALAYQSGSTTVPLGSTLSGGTTGGLMDFRTQMLDPVRNELGQIAVAVSSAINSQQTSGMDLNGALGTNLFAVGGVQVQPSAKNTGTATVAVTRTGVGALTTSDYILAYSGSAWSLKDAATGAAVTTTGTGTAADPILGAGLSIVLSGTPAGGDSYKVQPTANAVAGMGVLISDPNQIAAASPVRTLASTTNSGTGSISAGTAIDATNPQLLTPVTIAFTDATHYTLNGTGNYSYTPGTSIQFNGWQVSLSGAPAATDTFTVGPNTGGSGDNSNALAMSTVLTNGVLSGGKVTVNGAVTSLVGNLGVTTAQAQTNLAASQTVLTDSTSAVGQVSGVNLDEEAANLVRYQQAYQAAAQIIKTTQTLFASLLQAFA